MSPDTERGRLIFTASSESAVISFAQASASYAAADILTRSELERAYRRVGNSQDTLNVWLYRPDSKYIVVARQAVNAAITSPAVGAAEDTRFFLGGIPTVATDMPQTGGVSRSGIGFRGSRGYPRADSFFGGGGSANFDFATGAVRASIDIVVGGGGPGGGGTGTPFSGRLSYTGRIQSGTNRVEGTVTGQDNFGNQFTGEFAGQFFGPQADEFGFVCRLNRADGFSIVGVLYGQSR